jgi:serine/threonine protein kinase
MSLCINPYCSNPQNPDNQLFCHGCDSELLLDGRYRVTYHLGSGGCGKTYEVNDRDGISKVLKVLTNNHPKYVELFQREAQVLIRLKHQGIPKAEPDAYFIFSPRNTQASLHCLVMEKIEGLDLRQYLQKRRSPIDQKLAVQWLIQLATILQEVHSQNFFHRDIKPSNIMLKVDGQLVLIDFGTAREITQTFVSKQSSGQLTGIISAGYTPSEQLNGQAVPQSDFFALGRTFVYLLTGEDPNNFYDSYNDVLNWRHAAPQVSQRFADFLDRLMARFANQRPHNAAVILQELGDIKQDSYLPQVNSDSQVTVRVNPQTQPLQNSSFPASPTSQPNNFPASPTSQPNNFPASPTSQPNNFPASPTSPPNNFPASPTSPPNQTAQPSVPSSSPQIEPELQQDFINRCKQELAELIGPIASIICQRTLIQSPGISEVEFVKAVAKKIPDQKKALEFQRRLLS